MGRTVRLVATLALGLAGAAAALTAGADETSTGDKLRILYSNRFTFDDRGIPLITVELASGKSDLSLSAGSGMLVLPDGDGGAQVDGGSSWQVTVENGAPAVIREWTVVARLGAEDDSGARDAMRAWSERGMQPRRFEIGTIFGVEGEVIDSREILIAVSPVGRGKGAAEAARIARKHNVETSVHPEMVRRPQGVVVARSGDLVVRNPSVIWFRPKQRDDTVILDDVEVGRGGSQLSTSRERRRYWGSVYATIGTDGKLVAVNAVSADRLLAGLVPSEIFASAHGEALAAQAVAARTELLEKIGTRHLTDPYLLCSSQHCQVYSGAGREHPRTNKAVERTRGQILLRGGGGLVDARYSASCGGHGEHNDFIWGDAADPALRGNTDAPSGSTLAKRFSHVTDKNIGEFLSLPSSSAYCGMTRYGKGRFRWNKRLSAGELAERINDRYPGTGAPRRFEPLERGVSGRISKLRVVGSKRTIVVRGDLHIRRLLGGLRSSLFTVKAIGRSQAPSAFEFVGAGFGHGVGMCQTGAIGMAERGANYDTILRHYYRGSNLKRLY